MQEKSSGKETRRATRQPRASITFPPKLYRTLENLAKEKKVSLAWVVREAAEMYVAGQPNAAGKMRGTYHE
jgi:predicted DNA-binding protein